MIDKRRQKENDKREQEQSKSPQVVELQWKTTLERENTPLHAKDNHLFYLQNISI
jgi:hypothetical protein